MTSSYRPILPLLFLLALPLPGAGQAIIEAAKWGQMEKARAILAADPSALAETDSSGYSALRWAGIRGHGEVAVFLVEAGGNPNSVGEDGGTPLHGAAHHDDPAMMNALLRVGGDVTIQNRWGRTPLHVAARRGCLEVARVLLDAGADPNATTREGWTTLNVAYRGGHPEIAALLLEQGADPEHLDAEGRRPGEVQLVRPEPIALSRRQLDPYVGHYDLGGGFGFDVWRQGDEMHLMEFSPDLMIPVARDTFFCVQEPWRVVFHRDETGEISGMEVDFQRQTVVAQKIVDESHGHSYVGSRACLGCHQKGPGGGPAGHWIASRHSRALHTLSTHQARSLAASREEYEDIVDPSREDRCLMCHATGAQNRRALFTDAFDPLDGVGCEACHGPGSSYMDPEIMENPEAFRAHGGRTPNALTCRRCHRDEAFSFMERWDRIRHGG